MAGREAEWVTATWEQWVAAIIEAYKDGGDPEAAHGEEDELLESFVRYKASIGDKKAALILPLLNMERKRWYA
jgi:alkylated DNA repair dioxygenase AlkB